jgi:hypothetical protein
MSKNKFNAAAATFRRRLSENSPLEAPVRGFSRYARDMSPDTRELVLRARMPEIMAFAEDRRIDPAVVAGAVEASMRMGRIPDLGLYGLAGDEALAVKDFVATAMLGLEQELRKGLPVISENEAAKHLAFKKHYATLADQSGREEEELTRLAGEASKAGLPFTAAKHQAKMGMLKQLRSSHAALADYHGCESERCAQEAAKRSAVPEGAGPTNVDQPTGQPQRTAHPAQGATAAQRQEVPTNQRHEATSAPSVGPFLKPLGDLSDIGKMRQGAFLQREPLNALGGGKRKDPKDQAAEIEIRSEAIRDEKRRTRTRSKSSNGFFQKTTMMESMIAEAKKSKSKTKSKKGGKKTPDKKALGIKADPDKMDKTIANVKVASLFQQLGHKMDHACAAVKDKKVTDTWAKKLHKKCLSKGAPDAYHEIVSSSLAEPWIRDQGFVAEGANLTQLWQTMMSAETEQNASRASSTTPEPLVFTINRMIDMAQGRGSIY